MTPRKKRARLNPLFDTTFKTIFSDTKLLVEFLNAILEPKITSAEILSSEQPVDNIRHKKSVLDLKVKTNTNEIINIEIQLNKHDYYVERFVYYWAKIYSQQLDKRKEYDKLVKTISIILVDFKMDLNNDNFHSCFEIYDKKKNKVLTEHFEMHTLEIPKFRKDNLSDPLNRWMVFFNHSDEESLLEEVIGMDDNIRCAQEKLDSVYFDKEKLAQYEAELKAQREYEATLKYQVREKVKEELEGAVKGAVKEALQEERSKNEKELFEERKNVIKTLKECGLSDAHIQEKLGYNPNDYIE